MAYHDGEATLNGSLQAIVASETVLGTSVRLGGTLSSEVTAKTVSNVVGLGASGSLSSTAATIMYVDAYSAMYGFLSAKVLNTETDIFCPDIFADMKIQELTSVCEEGKIMSDNITRYRGDTYPIKATLGRNGNFNTSGITFKMSIQINEGTIYTSIGSVLDADNGIVEFELPAGSVDVVGEGIYDIQGEDTYVYTYKKGAFTLVDDLTV